MMLLRPVPLFCGRRPKRHEAFAGTHDAPQNPRRRPDAAGRLNSAPGLPSSQTRLMYTHGPRRWVRAGGISSPRPEISQMVLVEFDRATAQAWLDQGAPGPFSLAELGPGPVATLMADVPRRCESCGGRFTKARTDCPLEALGSSPAHRCNGGDLKGPPHALGIDSNIVICQNSPPTRDRQTGSFLTRLPIRQFVSRDGTRWREPAGWAVGGRTLAWSSALAAGNRKKARAGAPDGGQHATRD